MKKIFIVPVLALTTFSLHGLCMGWRHYTNTNSYESKVARRMVVLETSFGQTYGENIHRAVSDYGDFLSLLPVGRERLENERLEEEFIKYLTAMQHAINKRTITGTTPLMCAVEYMFSRKIVVPHLIALGADVNARDNNGRTALMRIPDRWFALMENVREERKSTIMLLLDHGADIASRDNKGKTALDSARDKKDTEFIDLVRECMKYIHAMKLKRIQLYGWIDKNPESPLSQLPNELVNIIATYAYGSYK